MDRGSAGEEGPSLSRSLVRDKDEGAREGVRAPVVVVVIVREVRDEEGVLLRKGDRVPAAEEGEEALVAGERGESWVIFAREEAVDSLSLLLLLPLVVDSASFLRAAPVVVAAVAGRGEVGDEGTEEGEEEEGGPRAAAAVEDEEEPKEEPESAP